METNKAIFSKEIAFDPFQSTLLALPWTKHNCSINTLSHVLLGICVYILLSLRWDVTFRTYLLLFLQVISSFIFTQNVTLPMRFFMYFVGKNHPPGFSITETLAWNGLIWANMNRCLNSSSYIQLTDNPCHSFKIFASNANEKSFEKWKNANEKCKMQMKKA